MGQKSELPLLAFTLFSFLSSVFPFLSLPFSLLLLSLLHLSALQPLFFSLPNAFRFISLLTFQFLCSKFEVFSLLGFPFFLLPNVTSGCRGTQDSFCGQLQGMVLFFLVASRTLDNESQLEEDEQLANAVQESLNVETLPRHGNAN